MATFTDTLDRNWEIRLDAPSILKIRGDCDPAFMLGDSSEDNTATRLQEDPVLLCRVIYLLCQKQCVQRQVSEEDFYLGVIGEAIDAATDALIGAMRDFSPRWKRELLAAATERQTTIRQKAVERALAKLNDPDLENQILDQLDQKLNEAIAAVLSKPRTTAPSSATSSPDSSASTPPA